jgi:hypothetical protein
MRMTDSLKEISFAEGVEIIEAVLGGSSPADDELALRREMEMRDFMRDHITDEVPDTRGMSLKAAADALRAALKRGRDDTPEGIVFLDWRQKKHRELGSKRFIKWLTSDQYLSDYERDVAPVLEAIKATDDKVHTLVASQGRAYSRCSVCNWRGKKADFAGHWTPSR